MLKTGTRGSSLRALSLCGGLLLLAAAVWLAWPPAMLLGAIAIGGCFLVPESNPSNPSVPSVPSVPSAPSCPRDPSDPVARFLAADPLDFSATLGFLEAVDPPVDERQRSAKTRSKLYREPIRVIPPPPTSEAATRPARLVCGRCGEPHGTFAHREGDVHGSTWWWSYPDHRDYGMTLHQCGGVLRYETTAGAASEWG
jgi:hypothetical protein